MHATRTLPSLALAAALALGAAACGDEADPAGGAGDEEMTEEGMTEEMTEDMTDEMTDEG